MIHPKHFNLSKPVLVRDPTPQELKRLDVLVKAFAPAFTEPYIVWKESTDWQIAREKKPL